MFPTFKILGYTVALYGLIIVIGGVLGVLYACYKKNYYSLKREDILFSSVYAGVGLLLGAKILYILVSLPIIIKNWDIIFSDIKIVMFILKDGFVFYGGLIGAVVGLYIYTRRYKINFLDMIETLVPSVPLIHAFGRIGCFFSGCCYGVPSDFGMEFNNSFAAPHDIKLFPIQLVESGLNFLLFAVLAVYSKKTRKKGTVSGLYLVSYTVIRFILEFFRYDSERGIFLLSTSQWISILLFLIGIFILLKDRLHIMFKRTGNSKINNNF